MKELSLFSGAGGGCLGGKLLGWTTIGYVEYDNYCQKILKQRIEDGFLDAAPIFGDIRAFVSEGYADAYQGVVDVLTAGFPCQPFSTAGKQRAVDDPRNMWPSTYECIRRIRPRYCLLENVRGLLAVKHGYFKEILKDLSSIGYDAVWKVISASEVGAPHKRDRLWIVAYPQSNIGLRETRDICEEDGGQRKSVSGEFGGTGNVAYPHGEGLQGWDGQELSECPSKLSLGDGCTWWASDPADVSNSKRLRLECTGEQGSLGKEGEVSGAEGCEPSQASEVVCCASGNGGGEGREMATDGYSEPFMGRVANGVAHRVDRLKALGNGQVPAVVRAAWHILTGDK